jgi:hypothetical protein
VIALGSSSDTTLTGMIKEATVARAPVFFSGVDDVG